MIYSKGSQKPSKKCTLDELVADYNSMMNDPKEYANTTYKSNIESQGRPWGGPRDARTKANKPWNKNDIPV